MTCVLLVSKYRLGPVRFFFWNVATFAKLLTILFRLTALESHALAVSQHILRFQEKLDEEDPFEELEREMLNIIKEGTRSHRKTLHASRCPEKKVMDEWMVCSIEKLTRPRLTCILGS